MSHWKLGRRHPGCLRCERVFVEGEAHYSMLSIQGDRLERLDLCHACWPTEPVVEGAQRAWWRARRPLNHKRGLSVDLEGLEALFHALSDSRSERLLELRYVLALLLLRKRRLFLVRATVKALGPGSDARGEFLVVRRPRRKEEEFLVQVFDFAPGRIEALRGDLERLFEGIGLEELAAGESGAEGQPGENIQVAESGADAGQGAAAQAAADVSETALQAMGDSAENNQVGGQLVNSGDSLALELEQDWSDPVVELTPVARSQAASNGRAADRLLPAGEAENELEAGTRATAAQAELALSAVALPASTAAARGKPSSAQPGARRARPKASKRPRSPDSSAS